MVLNKCQYVTFSGVNCGQPWVWTIDVVSSLISLHSVTPLINCWDYLTRDWQVTPGAPAVPISFHVTQFQDLTYFFVNSKLKVLEVSTKKLEDSKITEFWLPRILLAREKKKNLCVLIYSKLHSKSCDYLLRFSMYFVLYFVLYSGKVWLSGTRAKLVHALRSYPRLTVFELLLDGMLVYRRFLSSILVG